MKKIKNKILIISGLTLIASCSKVLDQEPVSQLTQANYWKNADDARSAIVGVYDGLQSVLAPNYVYWGDIRSDEFEFKEGTSNPSTSDLLIVNNNLTPDIGQSDWSKIYVTISRCNNVLTYVPGIEDSTLGNAEKTSIIGEAFFIRALAYFYATRIWGDVPLVLEPYTSADQDFDIARTDKDIVLDAIERDIEEAIKNLSVSDNSARASKGAAQALKAHVLAWRGDYAGVEVVAGQLISSGEYQLVPQGSYSTIFDGSNSSESIFELQFNFSGNQETSQVGSLFLAFPYSSIQLARFEPSTKFLNSFEPNDNRLDFAIDTSSITSAPYVRKYFGSDNGNSSDQLRINDDNIILYRLADIILLRAEALNELGRTNEAIGLLNQIRNRAGLSDISNLTQEEAKREILDERFRELCFEGNRFFDLIRNKLAIEFIQNIDFEEQLLWPVHINRILENPSIEQNEFYK